MVASRAPDRPPDASRGGVCHTPSSVSLCHGGSLLCLLILTALAYAPSLQGEYVYEDVRDAGLYAVIWPGWWSTLTQNIHPTGATVFVQAAVAHLTDTAPSAQRLVSLAWHLGNGLLLWLLARRVLAPTAAVLAVGLFLLHPIQAESVAYVAGRSELIVGTALLIALLAAERGWWVLAWVGAASAVLGKHAGVAVLALVPLWAWWRQLPAWTPRVQIAWTLACGAVVLVSLRFIAERGLFVARPDDVALTLASWVRLLALWAVPWGQTVDHDWTLMPTSVGLLAVLAWLAGLIWAALHRQSWMSLALLWSGLVVLPRLAVQVGEGPHEHHLYSATIALSMATGWWVGEEV